jgi:hypothetical protein
MPLGEFAKAVQVTQEMIDRRETVRRIAGDRYAEVTDIPRQILLAKAKADGKSILATGLDVCQTALRDGHGTAVGPVIAAMVDLIEEEG